MPDKFKFVFAGLHNVSRAKNATANNGIFGQMGTPLCVRPLEPAAALELLARPLSFLGFQVDKYPHLETILTTTNYCPGILQHFGFTLVQNMMAQYKDYSRAADEQPPFPLSKEQLGSIMGKSSMSDVIKKKFLLSLELDSRYYAIARCLAVLYFEDEGTQGSAFALTGYPVDAIRKTASEWDVLCLMQEDHTSFGELLNEMVDMGVLLKPNPNSDRFRFRRYAFLHYLGTDTYSILQALEKS